MIVTIISVVFENFIDGLSKSQTLLRFSDTNQWKQMYNSLLLWQTVIKFSALLSLSSLTFVYHTSYLFTRSTDIKFKRLINVLQRRHFLTIQLLCLRCSRDNSLLERGNLLEETSSAIFTEKVKTKTRLTTYEF